ncbi:MAG: RluA family pseudouridine synthase [Rubrivivax sp.]|nr:RluA family pseudouridine synthase [Rubrivivax sp.]
MCPTFPPLNTVFADAHLVVIDKPAGLLSVPGRGDAGLVNLTSQVQMQWPDALVVHRLDQATSGLIVFARGLPMQRALSQAFATRQVHKRYVAVVTGDIAGDSGHIDLPLGADWPRRPRQRVDLQQGKPAQTAWRVLAREAGATRLALQPITGRSHQLRVHLMAIGHPIAGDTLYAPQPLTAPRLLLHAEHLALRHPADGSACAWQAPLPF